MSFRSIWINFLDIQFRRLGGLLAVLHLNRRYIHVCVCEPHKMWKIMWCVRANNIHTCMHTTTISPLEWWKLSTHISFQSMLKTVTSIIRGSRPCENSWLTIWTQMMCAGKCETLVYIVYMCCFDYMYVVKVIYVCKTTLFLGDEFFTLFTLTDRSCIRIYMKHFHRF